MAYTDLEYLIDLAILFSIDVFRNVASGDERITIVTIGEFENIYNSSMKFI